jgi:methylated-DNA-[protein]-cysteine S-methyltransferase
MKEPSPTRFQVDTPLTTLAVTVERETVTEIRFGGTAPGAPKTRFERQVAGELEGYFAGTRKEFGFPVSPKGTAFQLLVWQELQRIPYGETRTYGELARRIGNRGASRAVGAANHHNPIPVVIPCHRVVASGGRLGGFGGGVELKRRMLELEASHTPLQLSFAR